MRFSLLTLVGLLTLVPVELLTLKNPTATGLSIIGYVVFVMVLMATWGAFCLTDRMRQFCKGVAVLVWTSILFGVFVREDAFITVQITPLGKLLAEFLEHPIPTVSDSFISNNINNKEWLFFKTWNYWSILNAGLIGGYLAMQIRSLSSVTVHHIENSAEKHQTPLSSANEKQQKDFNAAV